MLNELQHFVWVSELGTFTEAAKHAHLTQPALSASIKRLEDALDARLFDRGRHGAELTAEGRACLPRAQAALAAFAEAKRAIKELADLSRGEVRIGAGATACTYLLPKIIARFRKRHPGVVFRLRESTTEEALADLAKGEIDLAIVRTNHGDLFFVDELILVARREVPVKGASFVTFREGSTTRGLLDQHFPKAEIVMELGSIAGIKGNVHAGVGIALVSANAVRDELRRGRLVALKHRKTPIRRELRIVHRGIERLPPAARAFREALLES